MPLVRQKLLVYSLLAILGLAVILRLWGITFGMPYDFTPDEIHEIVRALKLGAGEYSWHMGKGGLYYFLFVEYGLIYVFWWITGQVSNPNDFALRFLQDPSVFYLAGRITVAVMGTLTCLVVYAIGKRLYDWRAGLAAALIGATASFHVFWSHYINVDIGMVLALWTSILVYMTYEQNHRLRWLIGAGALCGVAYAFKLPGAISALPLLLAIATRPGQWSSPKKPLRESAVLILAMLLTTAIVAPENLSGIGSLENFENIFNFLIENSQAATTPVIAAAETGFDDAVYDVTIIGGSQYFDILFQPPNILLTIGALIGAAIGIFQRRRWDIIWCVLIVVFLGVMTVADRPALERYMLPIVPALWLLAARAAAVLAGRRSHLMAIAIAIIIAVPLFSLIRQNYMFTRPDTRVMAKEWIESNVSADAKILMDGMRYRFIGSPPLNPNQAAVERRLTGADSEAYLSRGVSSRTLELYAEAMSGITGPKYDIHSTVWGINVFDLSYYVENCFEYIVTSSYNSRRFDSPNAAKRYPTSANFYQQLPIDSRFEAVYSAEPSPWKIQGPDISVYAVHHSCN